MKLGAFVFEILPLLAFFAGYQYFGLIAAAALSAVSYTHLTLPTILRV